MLREAPKSITKIACILVIAGAILLTPAAIAAEGSREFSAKSGGTLILDLNAGGTVNITAGGGSSISATYSTSCTPECSVTFEESREGLTITTRFADDRGNQNSDIDIDIRVPQSFDIELDSIGGGLSIDGVQGTFSGKTMGGNLTLNDVRGDARLKTMGGRIRLTNSELDGKLETMGGEVFFRDVIGDVRGSSMGGNVSYKNVQRRSGGYGSPSRSGKDLKEVGLETVQISTMGGAIEVEDAPEGADVHTMGGNIRIEDASEFVRAKTMGGDIRIDAIDGWVDAITMAGDVEVFVTGRGGEVNLSSNSGDIVLHVPSGFSMDLDLEIAFTRNSRKTYNIDSPGSARSTTTSEWDHDHGTPRKYIRSTESLNGGGNSVKIRTINGNITVVESR
jgi:DUF4097 and DUF4098 domain-containing protein YvlB